MRQVAMRSAQELSAARLNKSIVSIKNESVEPGGY